MTKRAVLYVRTNDGNQLKVTEQLQTSRAYAQDHGWHIVAELVDLGVSGLSSQASHLERAFALARDGECDVLVVCEESRLSRKLPRLVAIIEELGQLGIRVEIVSRGRDGLSTVEALVKPLKPIVVYARVSGDPDHRGGQDLERQTAILLEYAIRQER